MANKSLYIRLGGAAGISDLVVEFYERVLHDEQLAPFFAHVSMDHLQHMQQEFFTVATGGPASETGFSLHTAHKGRGISAHEYELFVAHLVATLETRIDDPDDLARILDRVQLERELIVEQSGEST